MDEPFRVGAEELEVDRRQAINLSGLSVWTDQQHGAQALLAGCPAGDCFEALVGGIHESVLSKIGWEIIDFHHFTL